MKMPSTTSPSIGAISLPAIVFQSACFGTRAVPIHGSPPVSTCVCSNHAWFDVISGASGANCAAYGAGASYGVPGNAVAANAAGAVDRGAGGDNGASNGAATGVVAGGSVARATNGAGGPLGRGGGSVGLVGRSPGALVGTLTGGIVPSAFTAPVPIIVCLFNGNASGGGGGIAGRAPLPINVCFEFGIGGIVIEREGCAVLTRTGGTTR